MSDYSCALCESKIMPDDIMVACTRCRSWMCSFCAEATEQCCVSLVPETPAQLPVPKLNWDQEVEVLTAKAVAFAIAILVLPFLNYWLYQQGCKMAMERMTPDQYLEWNQEYTRKFMTN